MKKKTKHLLGMVVVMFVLLGGYFALDLLPQESGEEEDAETETVKVADFTAEDITYYCYSNPEYDMGFYITEDGYVHYKDSSFPVNETSVSGQLSMLGTLTAMQVVEGTDKSEYGLDTPATSVAVTLTDGTERTFLIGDSALFEDGDYVLDVENNVIYLVDSSFSSKFNCSWSSMVQQEDKIKVSTDQIVDVTVQNGEAQTMYITYDETKEQPWQLTMAEGTFDGDSDAVVSALGMFSSYSLGTTMEYNCSDFSVYGLETPETVVTVRYTESTEAAENTEEDTLTEEKTPEIKELVFEFGDTDENGAAYVRVNGSSFVYKMTKYYTEGLSVFDVEELEYIPETEAEE